MNDRSKWFVDTAWLAERLDDPSVVIVDGSWHLPTMGRSGRGEYDAQHIPGAVFFDIDAVADTSNPLPHMLPSPDVFADAAGALGIAEDSTIVIYDVAGLSSAPRVWWTFRIMGAKDVRILDGGLPKWLAEGRPVSDATVVRVPKTFRTAFDGAGVKDLADVRAGVSAGTFQLVDARPAARFRGEAPEPRPWVKAGRVPGSFNVPSTELIADGTLKDADALRAAFVGAGVDLTQPVVTSCGSGVNAATLSLALDVLGVPSSLYDGSWTEWGAREDTAIATG